MIDIVLADYGHPVHAAALVRLLDAYARSGRRRNAVDRRGACGPAGRAGGPAAGLSVLAFDGEEAVGLINCIEGFSTFACRPLVNVHDVVVAASHRGQRITQRMLARVEQEAVARGACKLTLEVLQGNAPAVRAYAREGFAGYQLDPAFGSALFMQKPL